MHCKTTREEMAMSSRKLTLKMDDLKVNSFTAGTDPAKNVGTVQGHGTAILGTCFGTACAGTNGDPFDSCRGPSCVHCPSDTCPMTAC
jgi:hypothetical protein